LLAVKLGINFAAVASKTFCVVLLVFIQKQQAVKKVCGPKMPGWQITGGGQEMAVIIVQWQKF